MSFSILPWRKERKSNGDPFEALQQEMNNLFQQFSPGFELAPVEGRALADWNPRVNVAETEKEIQVTAELPGVEEKDIEVNVDGGVLTIKGEKKAEKEEKNKNYHRIERSYGTFQRGFSLPKEIDPEKVAASFKGGLLTVTLPKSWEAQQSAKRIPIKNG